MKPVLAVLALAGTALFAETHVSIGIGVGAPVYYPPPPPPVYAYVPPPCPGPGYVWVPGYWRLTGARYIWRAGYWAIPPYPGAYWVAPRYTQHRYYSGYWHRPEPVRFRHSDDRRNHRHYKDAVRIYRDHGRGPGPKHWRR